MALTKAHIRNISKDPPKNPDGIEVQFNPTEYTLSQGASYAEIGVPGLSMPLLQFVRGEAQTLSLELFLDGSDSRESVIDRLKQLRELVQIDSELHAPPVCTFTWGDTNFQGVVTSLSERYLLFGDGGEIWRARVTVTMKSYVPPDVQAREIDRHSPDRTKTHVVREGDRLDLIAEDEYGDPSLWTVIARHNQIGRPRFLSPGTVVEIPPL
jgi:nucleoid-associated protein YgaU